LEKSNLGGRDPRRPGACHSAQSASLGEIELPQHERRRRPALRRADLSSWAKRAFCKPFFAPGRRVAVRDVSAKGPPRERLGQCRGGPPLYGPPTGTCHGDPPGYWFGLSLVPALLRGNWVAKARMRSRADPKKTPKEGRRTRHITFSLEFGSLAVGVGPSPNINFTVTVCDLAFGGHG